MPSRLETGRVTPTALAGGTVAVLVVVYLALIALVMTYAALTVEYAESQRTAEAAVARLEAEYLARVSDITTTDYAALGYVKPGAVSYVSGEGGTALR